MVLDPGSTMIINEIVYSRRRIAIEWIKTQTHADQTSEATLQFVASDRLRILCVGTAAIAKFADVIQRCSAQKRSLTVFWR